MKPKKTNLRQKANNLLEVDLLSQGYTNVIGIDEVGRGSWAGPVTIGAYSYNLDTVPIKGIADSKLLSQKQRIEFSTLLQNDKYYLLNATPKDIDKHGVGFAIRKLIGDFIVEYDDSKTFFLIDGYFAQDFGEFSRQIKKGDMKHYSIACASILAKVYRDSEMSKYSKKYPGYDFENNVGYGTKKHREGIEAQGICNLHRKSYKPIQEKLEQMSGFIEE